MCDLSKSAASSALHRACTPCMRNMQSRRSQEPQKRRSLISESTRDGQNFIRARNGMLAFAGAGLVAVFDDLSCVGREGYLVGVSLFVCCSRSSLGSEGRSGPVSGFSPTPNFEGRDCLFNIRHGPTDCNLCFRAPTKNTMVLLFVLLQQCRQM